MAYLFKSHNAHLVNHLFQNILIVYLILLLIEQISPGFVSYYLNLNYLLIVVILSGIIDVFSEHPPLLNQEKPVSWKDYSFILLLGIAGFIIIKYKTQGLGVGLSWIISSITAILIILLSLLILQEDD